MLGGTKWAASVPPWTAGGGSLRRMLDWQPSSVRPWEQRCSALRVLHAIRTIEVARLVGDAIHALSM
jgi:hypothetical protein